MALDTLAWVDEDGKSCALVGVGSVCPPLQHSQPRHSTASAIQTLGGMPQVVTVDFKEIAGAKRAIRFHQLSSSDGAEVADRIEAALGNDPWTGDVVYQVVPAETEVTPLLDMAYLVATIAGRSTTYVYCGELDAEGRFLSLPSPIAIGQAAKELGETIVVPQQSAETVALTGADVIGVSNIDELRTAVDGGVDYTIATVSEDASDLIYPTSDDMFTIKGQDEVKQVLEIAVAGGHNLLLVGPPGEGKSAIASRAYTIMPPLSMDDCIEVTSLWQAAERASGDELIKTRPFVAATKNTSPTGLQGGGSSTTGPRPGLVTLAHRGILFADELFEWTRVKIDSLRIPLQEKQVVMSRRDWQKTFPADFQLIASANACPCGYWGHPEHPCECHENSKGYSTTRVRYVRKMSGPIMDRIDLKCWVPPLLDAAFDEPTGETSATIRQRVTAARQMQEQRYEHTDITRNAELGPGLFGLCNETGEAIEVLKAARGKLGLSTRGIDKLRAVARTCADLRQSEKVEAEDMERAMGYMKVELPGDEHRKSDNSKSVSGMNDNKPASLENAKASEEPVPSTNAVAQPQLFELAQGQISIEANQPSSVNVSPVGNAAIDIDKSTTIQMPAVSGAGSRAPVKNGAGSPALQAVVEQWLEYVKTSLAASTHQGYASIMRRWAKHETKAPAELAAADIISYLQSHLARGVSRRTVNTWLIAIRSFLGWAARQGLVDAQLKQQLPATITYQPSKPVAATPEEIDLILGQGGLPAPYRLAILLMFDLGLRVSEATELRWKGVDLASAAITLVGKGNKLRQLPIASGRLQRALAAAHEPGAGAHWPVVWTDRAGRRRDEPLNTTTIRERLSQACEQANLSRRLTPHSLRHGFAARAAKAGVNARFIQQALGHYSLDVTQRYMDSLTGDIDGLRKALSDL